MCYYYAGSTQLEKPQNQEKNVVRVLIVKWKKNQTKTKTTKMLTKFYLLRRVSILCRFYIQLLFLFGVLNCSRKPSGKYTYLQVKIKFNLTFLSLQERPLNKILLFTLSCPLCVTTGMSLLTFTLLKVECIVYLQTLRKHIMKYSCSKVLDY